MPWSTSLTQRHDPAAGKYGPSIAGLAYNPDTQHLFVMVNDLTHNLVFVLDAANDLALLGQFAVASFGEYSGAGLEMACDGSLWAVNQMDGHGLPL